MGLGLGSLIFIFCHIWSGISTEVGLTVAIALPVSLPSGSTQGRRDGAAAERPLAGAAPLPPAAPGVAAFPSCMPWKLPLLAPPALGSKHARLHAIAQLHLGASFGPTPPPQLHPTPPHHPTSRS